MWPQKNKEANIKRADTVTFHKMNTRGIFPFISLWGWGGWLLITKWHWITCWQFIRVSLQPRVSNTKWLMKVANHKRVGGDTSSGLGHGLPEGLIPTPGWRCQIQVKIQDAQRYSWLMNNTGLNCRGPLTGEFFFDKYCQPSILWVSYAGIQPTS